MKKIRKMAEIKLDQSWLHHLESEFSKPYMLELKHFLLSEKQMGNTIFPANDHIFNAFNTTSFNDVKVVIIGQDPYHGIGQAHGLSFSVPNGIVIPPSLKNIFKELESDLKISTPQSGDLTSWAKQGVLLLNATLTVRAHEAGSHQKKGWELFTDQVISTLSREKSDLVFLLWGKYALAKKSLIDLAKHHVLEATHPSPLSAYAGFLGCRHFSKTNKLLIKSGKTPIIWQV